MEKKLKHLEFIQSVITRMAGNSFLLKGWSITIVSALVALFADKNNFDYLLIACFPIIIFWALDLYFLRLERKFRSLYDEIIKKNEDEINFSMKIDHIEKTYCEAFFSITSLFYIGSIITISLIFFLI